MVWLCVFTWHLSHEQDVTLDLFLIGVKLVWIQIFLSPRQVA